MNKYFCEVGSEVKKLHNLQIKDALEINTIINNMKNKAGSVDNINTKILKTLVNYQ